MWITIGVLLFIAITMVIGLIKGRGVSVIEPKLSPSGGLAWSWMQTPNPLDPNDLLSDRNQEIIDAQRKTSADLDQHLRDLD